MYFDVAYTIIIRLQLSKSVPLQQMLCQRKSLYSKTITKPSQLTFITFDQKIPLYETIKNEATVPVLSNRLSDSKGRQPLELVSISSPAQGNCPLGKLASPFFPLLSPYSVSHTKTSFLSNDSFSVFTWILTCKHFQEISVYGPSHLTSVHPRVLPIVLFVATCLLIPRQTALHIVYNMSLLFFSMIPEKSCHSLFKKFLFIWLHRILSCSMRDLFGMRTLSCSLWDLVS